MATWRLNRRLASVMTESTSIEQLVQIVIRGISAGNVVEIDGLGSFVPDDVLGFRFEARQMPQVFVAHCKEDTETVRRLCDAREAGGCARGREEQKLVAGKIGPRAIESAIETSDFFLACYS